MKKSILFVLLVCFPVFLFGSWNNVHIKSGNFGLNLRYHLSDEVIEEFSRWSTYWPIIQLVLQNEDKLKSQQLDILLNWSEDDQKFSATFTDGPGTLVNKFIQGDSVESLMSSLSFNIKHGLRLQEAALNRDLRLYVFTLPFSQGRTQLRYNSETGENYHLYMGPAEAARFNQEYRLIFTDSEPFRNLVESSIEMDFTARSVIVNRNTIDSQL